MTILNYTILDFNSSFIDIQIKFNTPDRISNNILEPEYLKIDINRELLAEDFTLLSNETSLLTEIP